MKRVIGGVVGIIGLGVARFALYACSETSQPPLKVLTGFLDEEGRARSGLLVADDVGITAWRASVLVR